MEKILQDLMKIYSYSTEDAEEALEFALELMEGYKKHTEETETYATISINEMEKAIDKLHDLDDLLI